MDNSLYEEVLDYLLGWMVAGDSDIRTEETVAEFTAKGYSQEEVITAVKSGKDNIRTGYEVSGVTLKRKD